VLKVLLKDWLEKKDWLRKKFKEINFWSEILNIRNIFYYNGSVSDLS
jgi:hypothetical protein